MSKAKKNKVRAAEPSHRPEQTVEPPQSKTSSKTVANVPLRLVEENRHHSNQIINALTKAATTIAGKENALEVVEVMERLHKMQVFAENRQAEREFGAAKVAVAQELPTIPKTKSYEFVDKNNQKQTRMYSDRVDIESVLHPLCIKHGFSKEFSSKTDARGWTCQVMKLRHAGGHTEVYESPYQPLDTTGSKNNSQAASSTAEYGMKQVLKGAFNIIGVDFDDHGDNVNMPNSNAATPDKFTAKVKEEAQGAKAPEKPEMPLPEAAAAFEQRLTALAPEKRGEYLMRHIKLVAAMEAEPTLAPKAAELRKLCEVQTNAA